jgi:hypothetical protein
MCPSKNGINHSVVRFYFEVFRANRKPIVILSGITLPLSDCLQPNFHLLKTTNTLRRYLTNPPLRLMTSFIQFILTQAAQAGRSVNSAESSAPQTEGKTGLSKIVEPVNR